MTTSALLDVIEIASPCHVSWEQMAGDDVVRRCDACRLNVYNLSGMAREAVESLVQHREGRLCVRFYRRADGTILIQDCPVGLRAIRRRLARVVASIAALAGCLAFGRLAARTDSAEKEPRPIADGPLRAFRDWLDPQEKFVFLGMMATPKIKIISEDEDIGDLFVEPDPLPDGAP